MTIVDIRTPAYTPVARTLHWIVAVLYSADPGRHPDGTDGARVRYRTAFTICTAPPVQSMLLLAIIRLIYRLTHPPLPLPEMPAIQKPRRRERSLGALRAAHHPAARWMGRDLRLPSADHRLWAVRAAADPGGEPGAIRAISRRSSRAWNSDGRDGSGAHWRRAFPSFHQERSRPDADGQRRIGRCRQRVACRAEDHR